MIALPSGPVVLHHLYVRPDSRVVMCTEAEWSPPDSLPAGTMLMTCPGCFGVAIRGAHPRDLFGRVAQWVDDKRRQAGLDLVNNPAEIGNCGEPLRGDVQVDTPPRNPSWLSDGLPDPRLVTHLRDVLRAHPCVPDSGLSTYEVLARAACIWLANEIDAGTVTARSDYFAGLRDTARRILRFGGVE